MTTRAYPLPNKRRRTTTTEARKAPVKRGRNPSPGTPRGPSSRASSTAKEKWISKAIKKPGQLHRDLGVPQGKKIPAGKINQAAKGTGKTAQRARLAQTLKKMR